MVLNSMATHLTWEPAANTTLHSWHLNSVKFEHILTWTYTLDLMTWMKLQLCHNLKCITLYNASIVPIPSLAWPTPHSTREGRGRVTFVAAACSTGISFTHIVQALRLIIILWRLTKQLLMVSQLFHTYNFLMKYSLVPRLYPGLLSYERPGYEAIT